MPQGAGIGWAVLGDFDLAPGTVQLDDTTGDIAATDAVSFVRLDTAPTRPAAAETAQSSPMRSHVSPTSQLSSVSLLSIHRS